MADVPPPNLSTTDSPTLRGIFRAFGRGLIYALAFWAVYRVMLFVYPPTDPSAASQDLLRQRQTSQLNSYDEQAQRANQMIQESEKQQIRSNALLTKQEEQAKRLDAVLDKWEQSNALRK